MTSKTSSVQTLDDQNISRNELTKKAATVQVIASLLASLSVTSPGIGLGFPAITTQFLLNSDEDIQLTASQVSWFASITAISSPIGSVFSGYLAEKIGRRNTLLLINVIAIVSWLLIGFSSREDAVIFFIELLIGRALIGVTIGMVTTPVVMYCSEVCHPKIRGRMTVMSTPFFISFGSLIAYLLGYLFPNDFRLVSFISAGITFGTVLCIFIIPESPVYLVTKSQVEKARSTLAKLRNLPKDDIRILSEIQNIEDSRNIITSGQSLFSKWKEFGRPELYRPFIIMLTFFAVQQFSGIFVILVYAAQFSIEAGAVIDAFLSTVCIGVIRCLTTIFVGFLSVRFGRKPMTILSGIGMLVGLLGITLCAAFLPEESNFNWLPIVFLFVFIFTGTLGFLTLPFAMVAEMYPQKTRAFASGITMALTFVMSFAHIKVFSTIFEHFGNVVVFSFYSFVALGGVLFAIFFLPETKGKTLQEIEQYFKKK